MPGVADRLDGIPPPLKRPDEIEDIFLYGVHLNPPEDWPEDGKLTPQEVIAYAFCYQGHCYRLAIPAEFHFQGNNPRRAIGCGFTGEAGFLMWQIRKTSHLTRIEKRGGTAEELILDFNLPGRSPASLTYSAKVVLASNAGKVYE